MLKENEGVSRRTALTGLGVAAVAAGAAVALPGCASGSTTSSGSSKSAADYEEESNGEVVANIQRMTYPFRGDRQSGVYEAQAAAYVVAYDIADGVTRDQLIKLLKNWTKAAENMCLGYPVNEPEANKYKAPEDTGEAYDLGAAGLTITFGFGATLFEKNGEDRFGLASVKPAKLIEAMRAAPGDNLNQAECGGDIVIKYAAEDTKVAFHAMRNMNRLARGKALVKWTHDGWYHTATPEGLAHADRDLFGFRDGTSNPIPDASDEDNRLIEKCVWIAADDEEKNGELFENGTYWMYRKCRMKCEAWDEQTLQEQERVIGRTKLEGIPLSGGEDENAEVDLSATDDNGDYLIDPRSHVATLRAYRNEEDRIMFRFGWNYSDGFDSIGQIDCGLLTGGFARDPDLDFMQFLDRFRECDLTEYFTYTASSVFLIVPGMGSTDTYIGQKIFEATA